MRFRAILILAGLAALVAPVPAGAAEALDDSTLQATPLGAHAGWAAWLSPRNPGIDQSVQVRVRRPSGRQENLELDARLTPRDVALGPGPGGVESAVVVRCAAACGLARVDLRRRRRAVIASEAVGVGPRSQAAIWGRTVVFTRYGPSCDDLRVLRQGSIRRLALPCGRVADVALRGDRVVLSMIRAVHGLEREQVLTLRFGEGRARLLADGRGEPEAERLRPGQVALDDDHAYVARTAVRGDGCVPRCGLQRIGLRRGTVDWALPHDISLAGGMARLGDGRIVYQYAAAAPDALAGTCTLQEDLPCVVGLTSVDPFSGRRHALLSVVTIDGTDAPRYPITGQPVTLTGSVQAPVVQGAHVVGTEPGAYAFVELRQKALWASVWDTADAPSERTDEHGRFTVVWRARTGWLTAVLEPDTIGAAGYSAPGLWRTLSPP
ncbi:MAG: hypothetical protein JHC95_18985 [Solirubrobacteraceae bacterium]|nr:hypothetical protein [Solirubrobacteraceae bacterium]